MRLKLIAAGLLAIIIVVLFAPQRKWDKYYKNKMGKPPHQIIINALGSFQTHGIAIDLGCGVGNDALLLLKQGWGVWAIDSEPKAIQILKKRAEPTLNLNAITQKFDEESLWKTLPNADLIYAVHALPFCKQSEFKKVWDCIKLHLVICECR